MKKVIIAMAMIVRNPVAIWGYGGWGTALWAAKGSGWRTTLARGVPWAIEALVEEGEAALAAEKDL